MQKNKIQQNAEVKKQEQRQGEIAEISEVKEKAVAILNLAGLAVRADLVAMVAT